MKKLATILFVITLFAMLSCSKSIEESNRGNSTRIKEIEYAVIHKSYSVSIISVDGKEILVSSKGGMIELNNEK